MSTNAQRLDALTTDVTDLKTGLGTLTGQVGALVQALTAQASTPAAVATAVPAPTAPVSLVKEVLPEEALLTERGLGRAKGGHVVLAPEALVAAARVLRTKTPEVVDVTRENLKKRNITGVLLYVDAAGDLNTQYTYKK